MKIRRVILLPFLFAAWPILSLYARNMEQLVLRDLLWPSLAGFVVVTAAWILAYGVWREPKKAGSAVSVGVLLCMFYGPLDNLLVDWTPALVVKPKYVWLMLLVIAAVCMRRRKTISDHAVAAFYITAWVLVAMPLFQIVPFEYNRWISRRKIARLNTRAMDCVGADRGRGRERPNIYHVVLDAYGRADVLLSRYQCDNEAFIGALTNRGFFVARQSYANYDQTLLTLATSLNLDYVESLQKTLHLDKVDRSVLQELTADSRVRKTLEKCGYRFVAFATGYTPTELRNADEYRNAVGPSLFASTLVDRTPLSKIGRLVDWNPLDPYRFHRSMVLKTLHDLASVDDRDAPVFVFAHIMAPHPPFVFERDGSPTQPQRFFCIKDGSHFKGTKEEYQRMYPEQLVYVNKVVLESMDAVLRSTRRPTIIVLQSDHGPGSGLDWESRENSDLAERFGILQAYYFPDQAYGKLYDRISPVNTFRHILSAYFDEDWPLLPDESYYSTWERPFDFYCVSRDLP